MNTKSLNQTFLQVIDSPSANALVKALEPLFSPLPALPKALADVIVNFTPIVGLVVGILQILTGITSLMTVNPLMLFGGILNIIAGTLFVLAFSDLKAKKLSGWKFMFWSVSLNLIGTLISNMFMFVILILTLLISYYILFKLKPSYK